MEVNNCCKKYLEEWEIVKDNLKAEIEYHKEETYLVNELLTQQTERLHKIYYKYKNLCERLHGVPPISEK